MKHRIFFMLVLGAAAALRPQTGWFWQNPQPQGNTLNAVQCAGGDRVFAVGKLGTIVRSDDRGLTWQAQASGVVAELFAVNFFNADTGLVVGTGGMVLRTRDGGASWQQVVTPGSANFYAIFGFDHQTVLIAGSGGTVLQTYDGGDSWEVRDSKTTAALYAMAYNGIDYIYAAGAGGTLVRSKDGGASWTAYSWAATGFTIRALIFPGNNIGLAVGDGGRIYRSQTKGDTWAVLTILPGGAILRAIHFSEPARGHICGDAGTLLATSDAGLSWPVQSSNTADNLLGISFSDANNGVAAGVNGSLLFTSTSGNLWQNRLSSFTNAKLRGLCLVDIDVGVAVGDSSGKGMIFRSTDSGWNWSVQQRRAGVLFEDLCFLSPDSGFVVGSSGTILLTVNGGVSWSQITGLPVAAGASGPFVSPLSGIHFVTHRSGAVVGAGGTILRTSDAGATWVNQTNASYGLALQAVRFVHPDSGLAVGFLGTILRTVNGGAAWSKISSGTAETLNGVAFADPATAIIAGANGTILRSTTSGATWSKLSVSGLPAGINLEQVVFPAPQVGYIVGSGGISLRSEDGGASWRMLSSPTANSLNAVHFVNSSDGSAVGDNGVVLRTRDGGLPVELTLFSGRCDAASGIIHLTWKTATETSNYGFYVERRRSGAIWESLVFIAGHGTTANEQTYTYQDSPGRRSDSLEYRLRQMDLDGSSRLLQSIMVMLAPLVEKFTLWQNHPNPFNAATTFAFFLPRPGRVRLTLYDAAGRESALLFDGNLPSGLHRIPWSAGSLPSGLYLYRLHYGPEQATGKLILLR